MTPAEETIVRDPSPAEVEWILFQLTERLGVPSEVAAPAAAEGIDWHQVADLIAAGCEPSVAVEIVR